MRLDLREIPATIINLPKERKRRAAMTTRMTALGIPFAFSDGVTDQDGKIRNAAAAHRNAMAAAGDPPFMILEDDLEFRRPSTVVEDVPEDADVVYLGISSVGCFPRSSDYTRDLGHRGVPDFVLASAHNAGFARLHSMISAHAVLFLTRTAVDRYGQAQQMAVNRKMPLDVSYAYAMADLTVYAAIDPIFVEDQALQPQQKRSDWRAALTTGPLRLAAPGDQRTGRRKRYTIEGEVEEAGEGRLQWRLRSYTDHRAEGAEEEDGDDD